ncbi:MAG: 3'(2'),5'-bisphosphate nucleotidase CysQ [Bradyrhizobiaceae bacterium]|nr:MAG: 3'(2'),5'-bisphosphate nucleotidase CysQ [Bradyrhizobiaceae bacterium]
MPDAEPDTSAYATLLTDTVREAGALALRMFRTDLKTWTKGVSSPVSEADIAVNDLIAARLRAAVPGCGWLSEESAEDPSRLDKRLIWIVDPIDGTRSYLAGRDDWSISVALVSGGSPVLGAVFAPVTGEFYFAARSAGAELNGVAVQASRGDTLDFARVAGPKTLIGRLEQIGENVSVEPRIGSLALRLCRVADSRIDVACAGGRSQDWDLAAASLIVQEAGGAMTEINGDRLVFNRSDITHGLLLAAGRERHRRLVTYFQNNPGF